MENNPVLWNTEELNQWREELRALKQCREALSGADLSRAYHAQHVRHYDYDGRFDQGVKNWAQKQPCASQPPRLKAGAEPPRDFHELVCTAHPVILNFVCRIQMESEPNQNKPMKKNNRGVER